SGIEQFNVGERRLGALHITDSAAFDPLTGDLRQIAQALGGESLRIAACRLVCLNPKPFGVTQPPAIKMLPAISEGASKCAVEGMAFHVLRVGDNRAKLVEPTCQRRADGSDGFGCLRHRGYRAYPVALYCRFGKRCPCL